MKVDINYNQKNVIDFIQQQKDINFNDLIQNFMIILNLDTDQSIKKGTISTEEQVDAIFD